jgi:hypothetical protein
LLLLETVTRTLAMMKGQYPYLQYEQVMTIAVAVLISRHSGSHLVLLVPVLEKLTETLAKMN